MVGYDDSEAARTTDVPLTTVRQPSERMGVTIASILIDVLNGVEDHPRMTSAAHRADCARIRLTRRDRAIAGSLHAASTASTQLQWGTI